MKLTPEQLEVEQTLRALGASGTCRGFWCVIHGAAIALEDPLALCHVTKRLYPAIAEECGMSVENIRRDMRTLIEGCWARGDRALLSQIARRKLMTQPSVGEFIDILAGHLRHKGF